MENVRVNPDGKAKIKAWLVERVKKPFDNDEMIEDTVNSLMSKAEDAHVAGNSSLTFELKSWETISGHVESLDLPLDSKYVDVKFYISNLLQNPTKSYENLISAINGGGVCEGMEGIEFTPEMLAGEYAYYGIERETTGSNTTDVETLDRGMEEILYILLKDGAQFEFDEALGHAQKVREAFFNGWTE